MLTVEQEMMQRVRNPALEDQRRVLAFLNQLERPLSACELMQLPVEERQRQVQAAIALAADEDFEIFEVCDEEGASD